TSRASNGFIVDLCSSVLEVAEEWPKHSARERSERGVVRVARWQHGLVHPQSCIPSEYARDRGVAVHEVLPSADQGVAELLILGVGELVGQVGEQRNRAATTVFEYR